MISSITIQDAGPYANFQTRFNSKFNVFVGENGTGKSTLLSSLAGCWFSTYENSLLPKTRFGRKESKIQISASSGAMGEIWGVSYFWGDNTEMPTGTKPINEWLPQKAKVFLPPMIALNAYRKLGKERNLQGPRKEPRSDNKVSSRNRLIERFHQNRDDESGIQRWLVNRHFFSKETWGSTQKNELAFFIDGIEKAFPENNKVTFSSVNALMEPLFTTKHGVVPFQYLSSGIQSLIQIVYSLIEGLSEYYPDSRNVFLEKAIVLVDEAETHLHPAWQKRVPVLFKTMFPNCQFILTTHSPLVVSSCDDGEVIKLFYKDENVVAEQVVNTKGWLAENVLEDIFGIESSRDEETEKKVRRIRELFEKKLLHNLDQSEQSELDILRSQLQSSLPENDPCVAILKLESIKAAMKVAPSS